jgi:WD40 repeat protein
MTVLIEFASGQTLRELPTREPVGALDFRPDGDMLLTADWNGRVTFWDMSTGDPRGYGRVEKDTVSAASFAPDDTLSRAEMTDPVPGPDDGGNW